MLVMKYECEYIRNGTSPIVQTLYSLVLRSARTSLFLKTIDLINKVTELITYSAQNCQMVMLIGIKIKVIMIHCCITCRNWNYCISSDGTV